MTSAVTPPVVAASRLTHTLGSPLAKVRRMRAITQEDEVTRGVIGMRCDTPERWSMRLSSRASKATRSKALRITPPARR